MRWKLDSTRVGSTFTSVTISHQENINIDEYDAALWAKIKERGGEKGVLSKWRKRNQKMKEELMN